jgi:hypothetical protein
MGVLVVILGLGALVFAILTVVFASQANKATSTLNAQVSAAVKSATNTQKKNDANTYTEENESPFQTYDAPVADGSFVIKFPKDWSYSIDQEQSNDLLTMVMNPNYISTTNEQLNPVAAEIQLVEEPSTEYMQNFSGSIQGGTMKQSDITVSGQAGFNLTGTFDAASTVREVVVPVRDQTLVFFTQNSAYSNEFDEILAQAHIVP